MARKVEAGTFKSEPPPAAESEELQLRKQHKQETTKRRSQSAPVPKLAATSKAAATAVPAPKLKAKSKAEAKQKGKGKRPESAPPATGHARTRIVTVDPQYVCKAGECAAGFLAFCKSSRGMQVLVIRDRRTGNWSVPKGAVKAGEKLVGAASREVEEETGLDPELLAFFHDDNAVEFQGSRGSIFLIIARYKGEILPNRGWIVQDPDVDQAVWMGIEGVNRVSMLDVYREAIDLGLERYQEHYDPREEPVILYDWEEEQEARAHAAREQAGP
jgi:8-oxo-dGTP pyrophosphatase MutT (NUDIX family)